MQRDPSLDVCWNRLDGNSESMEANWRPEPSKERHRRLIMETILLDDNAGKTCDEVEQITGLAHQTCSARFADLKKDGLLVPTGERRQTRTRSMAGVYRVIVRV